MKTVIQTCVCIFLSAHLFSQEVTEETFRDIVIFPNPTSEILFLKNGERIDSYRIQNLQGQVVQEGVQNAQIISLIDLPVGVYFLEMKIGDQVQQRRIEKR